MGLSEDFQLAAEEATKLPEKVTNQDKLKLYGLFKQASAGDVNTGAPPQLSQALAAITGPLGRWRWRG